MSKKIIYILIIIFFVTSCAEQFDSIKRGLTGGKKKSSDEFLVRKKDPLILPPDFENLPTPDDSDIAKQAEDEASIFEKKLSEESFTETIDSSESSSESSSEMSILKQIRKNK